MFGSQVDFKAIFKEVKKDRQFVDSKGAKLKNINPTGRQYVNLHTKFPFDLIKFVEYDDHEFPTVNFFFCIKHKNGGKI